MERKERDSGNGIGNLRDSIENAIHAPGRLVPLPSILLLILAAGGCKENYCFGEGKKIQAKVETPSGVQAGNVAISYTLSGPRSPGNIVVSYSTDGRRFHEATRGSGGEGTRNLPVMTQGARHTFVWDSGLDLEHSRCSSVILRVAPEGGLSNHSDPVVVHNSRFLATVTGVEPQLGRSRLVFGWVDAVGGQLGVLEEDVLPLSFDLDQVIFHNGHLLVSHTLDGRITALKVDEEASALVPVRDVPSPFAEGGPKALAADDGLLFILNKLTGTLRVIILDETTDPIGFWYGPTVRVPGGRALAARPGKLGVVCETWGEDLIHVLDTSRRETFLEDKVWKVDGMVAPTGMVLVNDRMYVTTASSESFWSFREEADDLTYDDTWNSNICAPGIKCLSLESGRLLAIEGLRKIISIPVGSDGNLARGQGSSFGTPGRLYASARGAGRVIVATAASREGAVIETWAVDHHGLNSGAFTYKLSGSRAPGLIAISD